MRWLEAISRMTHSHGALPPLGQLCVKDLLINLFCQNTWVGVEIKIIVSASAATQLNAQLIAAFCWSVESLLWSHMNGCHWLMWHTLPDSSKTLHAMHTDQLEPHATNVCIGPHRGSADIWLLLLQRKLIAVSNGRLPVTENYTSPSSVQSACTYNLLGKLSMYTCSL